ncbi:hypothetical protein C8A01DRAFT_12533, partial [Parachaetomium inaequale]
SHQTMNILACNDDVLYLILRCLSQADLLAVCLVHRRLHGLAEPILYSAIDINWQGSLTKPHPITALVRSILGRTRRATYIRSVSCSGRNKWQLAYRGKALRFSVLEPDLKEPISFVKRSQVPFRDSWVEELRNGSIDAYLAVLLSQLPRLRHLHLGPYYFTESRLVGLVFQSVLSGSPPGPLGPCLQRLETVSLQREESRHTEWHIRNTANVLPLFYLPSIREITAPIDDPVVFSWPTASPPSPNLVSLGIADLRESHLGQLLSITRHLHSLQWTWHFSPDFEDEYNSPVVDLGLIMPALEYARDTLTELTIHGVCDYAYRAALPVPLRVQGSARGLSRFNQLKKLMIPPVFITGFSIPIQNSLETCLPPNLESLTLTDDLFRDIDINEQWDELGHTRALVPWLANVETSTPRLRKLCLVLENPENCIGYEAVDVRNEIRELASRAGIELEIKELYE